MIIDGNKARDEILDQLAEEIKRRKLTPCLATFLVGDDPASVTYVANKIKACDRVRIRSRHVHLPANTSEKELLSQVAKLNKDKSVNGILVQFPLPKQISQQKVMEAISPEKDVDGTHPISLGRLLSGNESMPACTPAGVITLLEKATAIKGKHAVVVGRSNTVGKPLAVMLLNRDATVTVCHSKTKDLAAITRQADILCVAVGRPKMITKDMVKKGAVVIDIGINRVDGKLIGDVDFEGVKEVAAAITPVPGGVGPMTIASLMQNTVRAAVLQKGSR